MYVSFASQIVFTLCFNIQDMSHCSDFGCYYRCSSNTSVFQQITFGICYTDRQYGGFKDENNMLDGNSCQYICARCESGNCF